MCNFIYDDGGRKIAGFKGITNDCVTRAIAIITEKPYQEIYFELKIICDQERASKSRLRKSSPRMGIHKASYKKYLETQGFVWHNTMSIGSGCKIHLSENELPAGKLLVQVSRHLVAVIDGVVHDTHDCSRNGKRCVYGYWTH